MSIEWLGDIPGVERHSCDMCNDLRKVIIEKNKRIEGLQARLEQVRTEVKKLEEDGRQVLLLLDDLQGIKKALEGGE